MGLKQRISRLEERLSLPVLEREIRTEVPRRMTDEELRELEAVLVRQEEIGTEQLLSKDDQSAFASVFLAADRGGWGG